MFDFGWVYSKADCLFARFYGEDDHENGFLTFVR